MTTTAAQSVDRRRAGRHRALLTGKLANEDATTTIDCVIRNISDTGAMIETSTPHLIPNRLHLVQIKDGTAWDVEVIWRRGNRIGLTLGDRHDLRESTDRQLKALRAIWSQMALR
ncbi:MAG: PilZ domain-containing protein [Caulobacter sp.]|nr:PilZ domain-containing protein [Caulobacter sp.]